MFYSEIIGFLIYENVVQDQPGLTLPEFLCRQSDCLLVVSCYHSQRRNIHGAVSVCRFLLRVWLNYVMPPLAGLFMYVPDPFSTYLLLVSILLREHLR